MKKYFPVFSTLFLTLFSMPVFAAEYDNQGRLGQTAPKIENQGGGIQDKACLNHQKNQECTVNGSRYAVCEPILEHKGDKTTKLSCVAKLCQKGFLLEINKDGNSLGLCRKESEAQKKCDLDSSTCGEGQKYGPNKFKNPNSNKYPKRYKSEIDDLGAYQNCFCAFTNKVTYSCGDGKGTPPVDNTPYTNQEEIIIKENTGCTKDGSTFSHWECNGNRTEIGALLNTSDAVHCVAQWSETGFVSSGMIVDDNIKAPELKEADIKIPDAKIVPIDGNLQPLEITTPNCPTDATGNYPDCNCTDTDKKYNNTTHKCECPPEKPENADGKCETPTKCPDDATGDYPNCNCTANDKEYDKTTNKCVCKDKTKIYNSEKKTCECPSNQTEDESGNCITQNCPADATGTYPNCKCNDEDKKYDKAKNECVVDTLQQAQDAYDDAKAKEQSTANKTLTALTTAATGIGGMQLAQGLAEKSADKNAEQDMAAYIATMRCTYADGKSVKFGTEEIELPGANNAELMKLRNEYFALASDLKERKTALGMKPGIESEEILDRATSGLYDDEFVGIEGGNYASLYRANALNSEADQKQIADEQKKSKNRVIAGGVLAGAGVVGGVLGNSLINGKLGEKIKERKEKNKLKSQYAIDSKETIKTLSDKALEKYNQQYGNQD